MIGYGMLWLKITEQDDSIRQRNFNVGIKGSKLIDYDRLFLVSLGFLALVNSDFFWKIEMEPSRKMLSQHVCLSLEHFPCRKWTAEATLRITKKMVVSSVIKKFAFFVCIS